MNCRYSTYRLFKKITVIFIYLVITTPFSHGVHAAEVTSEMGKSEISNKTGQTPGSDTTLIIEPNIKRSPQGPTGFDTVFFQIEPFVGVYKLDGFGTETQKGVKLAFHVHRRLFFEFAYGLSEIDESTRTDLGFLPLIENKELDYYDLSIGYNMLISRFHCKPCGNRVLNTDTYLTAGIGKINIDTTDGNDINDKSINFGIGLRASLIKNLYINTSIKNQTMKENLVDNTSSAHNLLYDLGLGIYF